MDDTTADTTPDTPDAFTPPPNYIFPTFAEKAKHLVAHHPPKDADTGDLLDIIRQGFDELVNFVGPCMPEGPDAIRAAYAVRDACQACIAAVVLNQ